MSYVRNQWGQKFWEGDIVAYVSKTGSHTTRKLGVVTELTETLIRSYPKQMQDAVRVRWVWDGSYCDGDSPYSGLRRSTDKPSVVRVNNVIKVWSTGLSDSVREALLA